MNRVMLVAELMEQSRCHLLVAGSLVEQNHALIAVSTALRNGGSWPIAVTAAASTISWTNTVALGVGYYLARSGCTATNTGWRPPTKISVNPAGVSRRCRSSWLLRCGGAEFSQNGW